MRPAPLDIKRQGDLGGQKIGMKINVNSLDKIMSLLTDLYSDPAMAVIREYSTNARDSHVAAGKADVPIEVTTPNALSPFFRVKDFGLGMSIQDIEDTYSQYGASTKEGSDDYNGMLGLGCKSALTFTQQFTLISVHNGLKISVSISRVEDGTGQMEIVDTRATDDPNGVEIVIPVALASTFRDKITSFYQYWRKGTVLVDGLAPEFIGDSPEGSWVDDDILMLKNTGQDYVVMGGVAYPTRKLRPESTYSRTYSIVAFVEMGAVQFPPSRESLFYSEKTLATVDSIRGRVEKKIAETGQAELDACADYEEAEALYLSTWSRMLPHHKFTYKELDFIFRWDVKAEVWYTTMQRHSIDTRKSVDRSYLKNSYTLVITNFKAGKLTPTTRAKTRMYLETMPHQDIRNVVFLEKHPDPQRILNLKTVDWDTIKSFQIVRAPKGKKKLKLQLLNNYGRFNEVDDLDKSLTTVYIGADMWKQVDWNDLTEMTATHNIVKLYVAQKEAFNKLYPDAKYLIDYLKLELIEKTSNLTDMDKAVLSNNDYYERALATRLNPDEIDDPVLAEYIRNSQFKTIGDTLKAYQTTVKWARAVKIYVSGFNEKVSILKDYPLAKHASQFPEHATIYINTIFALKNGAKCSTT